MLSIQDFTQINNNSMGNPRYVCHFLGLVPPDFLEPDAWSISAKYNAALDFSRPFGGKKFHNRQYGGGIVFCTYDLPGLVREINYGLTVEEFATAIDMGGINQAAS